MHVLAKKPHLLQLDCGVLLQGNSNKGIATPPILFW
jgi:hypothetical protein